MSLWSKYLEERENKHVLETEDGFAVYQFNGDECYLIDIYVVPEKRKTGVAAHLADRVMHLAKVHGSKWLVGSVSPGAKNAHTSLLVLLAYGMKLTKSDKDIIYFSKGI